MSNENREALTIRDVLRKVILEGDARLLIPTEDIPKVRKAFRNLKGKLNMKLRSLGVKPIQEVLVFREESSETRHKYSILTISLETQGAMKLTPKQQEVITEADFLI